MCNLFIFRCCGEIQETELLPLWSLRSKWAITRHRTKYIHSNSYHSCYHDVFKIPVKVQWSNTVGYAILGNRCVVGAVWRTVQEIFLEGIHRCRFPRRQCSLVVMNLDSKSLLHSLFSGHVTGESRNSHNCYPYFFIKGGWQHLLYRLVLWARGNYANNYVINLCI